ncbi:sensor histidine kinase [Nonomuraea ceibae]|uniref:sensor histidine kinase n=1 Tax=Nonomuraea ceibae TaxID=1935170 RepID=UPI001C5DD62F|nr:histidine kinase [Nonomuraea ceibae]
MKGSVALRSAGAIVVLTTAAAAVSAYFAGFRYGGDAPVFVMTLTAAVLTTAGVGISLTDRSVARWLNLTAAALFAYLATIAAASWYAGVLGHRDLLARSLVGAAGAGYILAIALLQACFLAAVGRSATLLICYAAAFTLASVLLLPDAAFSGLEPVLHAPALESAIWIAALPWMASVLAGPIAAWRALARTRGAGRHRTLMIAVISLVPIGTVLFAALSALLALALDVMSPAIGETGQALAFGVPFVVSAAGLYGARFTGPEAVARTVTVVVGSLIGLVVVALSVVLGTWLGSGALLPIVIGTLGVAGTAAGVRRRVVRQLLLHTDPMRARAAALVHEAGAGGRAAPARTAQVVLADLDPRARLLLRLPQERGWADAEGNHHPEPGPGTSVPDADGRIHAHVRHTGDLDLDGVLAEVGMLIELAVLEAAVRDQEGRVAAERARADHAAAVERRRLERDLHDGVQGRLLALALELRMAQRELGDAAARLVLSDAVDRLSAAIEELRTLASGTAPEILTCEGLGAALIDLSHRMPVPITVTAPAARLPPETEAIAYLVVCEAVTNVLKHAHAGEVQVEVTRTGEYAVVTVADDGGGGADMRAGSGLRGLSERVSTAGGRLVVSDRRPHGTLLEVTLPCAW